MGFLGVMIEPEEIDIEGEKSEGSIGLAGILDSQRGAEILGTSPLLLGGL